VRGTFDVHEKYARLDVVMMDGASFIAKCDNPASSGKAESAAKASLVHLARAARRARGTKLLQPSSQWHIVRAKYRATPFMSDGSPGPELNLRELLRRERF
jgi:hypothetical protein